MITVFVVYFCYTVQLDTLSNNCTVQNNSWQIQRFIARSRLKFLANGNLRQHRQLPRLTVCGLRFFAAGVRDDGGSDDGGGDDRGRSQKTVCLCVVSGRSESADQPGG